MSDIEQLDDKPGTSNGTDGAFKRPFDKNPIEEEKELSPKLIGIEDILGYDESSLCDLSSDNLYVTDDDIVELKSAEDTKDEAKEPDIKEKLLIIRESKLKSEIQEASVRPLSYNDGKKIKAAYFKIMEGVTDEEKDLLFIGRIQESINDKRRLHSVNKKIFELQQNIDMNKDRMIMIQEQVEKLGKLPVYKDQNVALKPTAQKSSRSKVYKFQVNDLNEAEDKKAETAKKFAPQPDLKAKTQKPPVDKKSNSPQGIGPIRRIPAPPTILRSALNHRGLPYRRLTFCGPNMPLLSEPQRVTRAMDKEKAAKSKAAAIAAAIAIAAATAAKPKDTGATGESNAPAAAVRPYINDGSASRPVFQGNAFSAGYTAAMQNLTRAGGELPEASSSGTPERTNPIIPHAIVMLPMAPKILKVTQEVDDKVLVCWTAVGDRNTLYTPIIQYELFASTKPIQSLSDCFSLGTVLATKPPMVTVITLNSNKKYYFTICSIDSAFRRSSMAPPATWADKKITEPKK